MFTSERKAVKVGCTNFVDVTWRIELTSKYKKIQQGVLGMHSASIVFEGRS